ncbi:hypothetical protein BDV18DRAFT_143849 [Aspergillus unguis]
MQVNIAQGSAILAGCSSPSCECHLELDNVKLGICIGHQSPAGSPTAAIRGRMTPILRRDRLASVQQRPNTS